jgi:hypothetical protein
VTSSARHQPNDLGNDDLPARGGVAEPRGFDDRSAEEVAALVRRFAGGDADADLRRAVRRLLRGNGAGDGVGGAVETQHEPIAGRLHLAAVVFGNGRAQSCEVCMAQRFVGVVPEAIRQLGRADEIGEDNGDGLGARHASFSCCPPREVPGARAGPLG